MGKTFVYENKALNREAHVSGCQGEFMVERFENNALYKEPQGFYDSFHAASAAALKFVKGEG